MKRPMDKTLYSGNDSDESAYMINVVMNLGKDVVERTRGFWYLDSGATSRMTNNKMEFVSFISVSAFVLVKGDIWLAVAGIGDVQMDLLTDTGRYTLLLREVRYIPELQCSSFSIHKQVSRGLTPAECVRVHFDEDGVADVILESGVTTAVVNETSLYRIDFQSTPNVSAMAILHMY
ncbi:unnamed protein product [Phytophthora fragariaefolia]|uniref:Unnamed protein product n=1 Tax=Phytophthora fragariaefolia TaxID=1490495 RepID=A0A9W6YG17_9STRA|nr:unnamed protein product [Phytophthora fragariaefolia]